MESIKKTADTAATEVQNKLWKAQELCRQSLQDTRLRIQGALQRLWQGAEALRQRYPDLVNEKAWTKAHRRCHRIGVANVNIQNRKKLIRSMELPKVLWNAGWQRLAKQKMHNLSNAIEGCVRGRPPTKLGKKGRDIWSGQ